MKNRVFNWVKDHIRLGITPGTEDRKLKDQWKRVMLKIRFKF